MSGLIRVIYARQELEGAALDAIDGLLAGFFDVLDRTRKGRVWSGTVHGRSVHVRVEETGRVLWDCEDDLLELGLSQGVAPFRIVLEAPCRASEDVKIIKSLTEVLGPLIDGVITQSGG